VLSMSVFLVEIFGVVVGYCFLSLDPPSAFGGFFSFLDSFIRVSKQFMFVFFSSVQSSDSVSATWFRFVPFLFPSSFRWCICCEGAGTPVCLFFCVSSCYPRISRVLLFLSLHNFTFRRVPSSRSLGNGFLVSFDFRLPLRTSPPFSENSSRNDVHGSFFPLVDRWSAQDVLVPAPSVSSIPSSEDLESGS